MSMQDKSKRNRDLAHQLADEDIYTDIVANRYYFSCFQKLLYLAQTKLQYTQKDNDKSSHMSLIFYVETEVNKAMKDDERKRMKLIRAKDIRSIYTKLKNLRVKADYQSDKITMDEIRLIKEEIKRFDDCYQIIKNEM